MAIRDTEAFIRQRATLFDPNLDVNPGAPFDVQVIQPLVRRLGQDPFTVDITTFVNDRLEQAFPLLATKEGDALTDLLNKPASVLWDPIVREIRRTQRSLSFRDPSTLTLDEADALGANLFNERRKGDLARGVGRIFFRSPQNASISPANFFTSRGGLHFFPLEIQSIRTEEMLLNVTPDNLYYFDVNAQAEAAGSNYNIGPNELVSVANVPAAVRVSNTRRFGFGQNEETAEQYVGRVRQSLSERSLVTLRGIAAKILNNFPDVNRLNVVGFNDPEMQRDVVKGGGLGELVASGNAGSVLADGENQANSRRFFTAEVDFLATILGDDSSFVLTVFNAATGTDVAQDFDLLSVVGANEVNVADQRLILGSTAVRWTLRKRELTLSNIPGGILFPDGPNGTVDVPDDEIHIGGAYDVHLRGIDFEEGTLAIDNVTDDVPLLSGFDADVISTSPGTIRLDDLVLDTNYSEGDETHEALERAASFGYVLQLLESTEAGNYRVLGVTQVSGLSPELVVDPAPAALPTELRWRLFDQINIDLVEPKETRIEDSDLRTVQGSNIVDTIGGTNFDDFGVAEDDVLRLLTGPDAGDFTITADPIGPSFDKLELDKVLTQSQSNLDYIIFRPNSDGGVLLPLVRITQIELLDSSNQPIGSMIPYALPVDIQSRAFQNPARGIKHDFRDAVLGLVSEPFSTFGAIAAGTLDLLIDAAVRTVTFGAPASITDVITEINADILAQTGIPNIAVLVGVDRFGIRPVQGGVVAVGGTNHDNFFGTGPFNSFPVSTFDIRSADIDAEGGFDSLDPPIDLNSRLDVVQVLDGDNAGFYDAPFIVNNNVSASFPALLADSPALTLTAQDGLTSGFAPAITKRVQIGARSLGSVRVFFLEPTSFEVDPETIFTLGTEAGDLNFLPDPTLKYEQIPAQPGGSVPLDGETADGGSVLTSLSQDFVLSAIQPGDEVVIENFPLGGSIALPDPVPDCVQKTLIYSLDGGPDRTLTFIRDDVSLNVDEVSRQGVVDQINASAGETICSLTGGNTVEFETTRELVIRSTGTANVPSGPFPGILGDVAGTGGALNFGTADQNNESPHAGSYTVDASGVGQNTLTVEEVFPSSAPYTSPITRQSYRVFRQGLQRITATAMADNQAEASLFFFDVELISEGSGDEYNIDADLQLTATGFRSDGYFLTTDDENLTFSPVEPVKLVLSRTILEQGVDDDPVNATQVSGQNIQITYERAPLVEDVNNYLLSDVERVVCSSPLSRHLIPVFVRFDLNYTGGSRESVVVPEVETHIRDLFPIDPLESADLQKIVLDRGATSIENPLDLIGIVHRVDRSVYAVRSQNFITSGRLSAFIPDVLNIQRNTT